MRPDQHGGSGPAPRRKADQSDLIRYAALLAAAESLPDGWAAVSADLEPAVASGTDVGELARLLARSSGLAVSIDREREWAQRLASVMDAHPAVRILDITDPGYPANLRDIPGRPVVLFVKGELLEADRRAVAIVGSRDASARGLRAAGQVAGGLVDLGFTIVSGLASGIDAAAHEAALERHGRTIAVIGTGIDRVFPEQNAELARRIPSQGALVSQFPPGHGPTKTTFPARNSVIAGLSLGSVLVEGKKWSGTRIETDRALEQGRPVFIWASVMGDRPWVQRFASTPGVHIVESVDQIATILASGAEVDRRGIASDYRRSRDRACPSSE
jgi:DNA processing protein